MLKPARLLRSNDGIPATQNEKSPSAEGLLKPTEALIGRSRAGTSSACLRTTR